jgi:hypothetical protein
MSVAKASIFVGDHHRLGSRSSSGLNLCLSVRSGWTTTTALRDGKFLEEIRIGFHLLLDLQCKNVIG